MLAIVLITWLVLSVLATGLFLCCCIVGARSEAAFDDAHRRQAGATPEVEDNFLAEARAS